MELKNISKEETKKKELPKVKNVRSGRKKKIDEFARRASDRFLEIQLNGAGIITGLDTYTALKGQPNYTGEIKLLFPVMELLNVTVDADNNKNIAVTETVPTFEKGMALVLFSKTELDTIAETGYYKDLADTSLVETINITAIDVATKQITLEREVLNPGWANAIILLNDGFINIGSLKNFEVDESQEEINTDTNTSGGYKSSIGGLKSAGISGVNGLYNPNFPVVATLNAAYDGESVLRVRTGAIKEIHASYTEGSYKVTEFKTSGETSGNSAIEYQASMALQAGQIEKKTFI